WTSDGFRTSWSKVLAKTSITGLTFNDLRGTAVTRLALAGCNEAEIAAITQHSLDAVGQLLDAHYLGGRASLANQAMRKLADRYDA
ncbi:MAG: integrase, partial [Pseudomonadota bacterium]